MWEFVFTIVNGSTVWTIPGGATAVLNGYKPDGNVFSFAGTISSNTVIVDCDVQMTAVAGDVICELSISSSGTVIGTANFILAVEPAPVEDGAVVSDSDIDAYGAVIANEVGTYIGQHPEILSVYGLTDDVRQALLALFEKVAYIDTDGQDLYDALELALYPPKNLVSISAVFTQGVNVVYDTDPLDTLRQYLVVTATYDDYTTANVSGYALSGTLAAGTSTITVTYGGKTDTFTVTVTADPLPSDYTKVLYVASTSTGQSGPFVNTQVTPSANSAMTVTVGFMMTSFNGDNEQFIGSLQKNSSAAVGFGVGINASGNPTAFNGITSAITASSSMVNVKLNLVATFSSTSSSLSDGSTTVSNTGTGRNHDNPIHLFGIKRNAASSYVYPAQGRIYYAKVIDNNSLILNIVPVTRNSDSVAGFWDYVNERFITAEGLTAGTTE